LIGLFVFFFFNVTGYTFKLLVGLMGVSLSFVETLGLSILTNFGNYLAPTRPGAAIKAVYLKSSAGLAYSHFGAVLAANLFIGFFMTGLSGLGVLLFFRDEKTQLVHLLFIICAGLTLVSIIPFFTWLPKFEPVGRLPKILHSALTGFKIIRAQKFKLFLICFSYLAQFLISGICFKLIFYALGIPVDFVQALVVGIFGSIANLFTITPNNLGVQEAVSGYLFTLSGLDFTSGVLGAGILRVIHIFIVFILAPLFFYLLVKKTKIRLPLFFSFSFTGQSNHSILLEKTGFKR